MITHGTAVLAWAISAPQRLHPPGQNKPLSPEDQEDAAEPDWESEVKEISLDDLLTFDRDNDPDNLIGNRWHCRGDTAVIQGETGIGKSTLIMQAIISWAMGAPLFGIKGKRNYKSLLIESENNQGDLAEGFQDCIKAMDLRADQIAYLKTKIVIVRESAKTGRDFLKLARRLIKKHKRDLVFADPLLSYLGDNASDQKAMSAFLRNGLQPIVQVSKVAWFWGAPFLQTASRR
jgi:RecA-family ATPase